MKRLHIFFLRWRKHRRRVERLERALARCWFDLNHQRCSERQIRRMGKAYRKIIDLI